MQPTETLAGDTAGQVTRSAGSLPEQPSSYVGRRAETQEVRRLLGQSRLVTLTGPGGVGKTRLATQAARAARGAFADGAAFVGLAELADPELLVSAVSAALGLGNQSTRPPVDLLVEQLRRRRMLVVLDNCEHLQPACAALAHALIVGCPKLVLLATSRQSLGVDGERVLTVPPLDVPADTRNLTDSDSVRLLVERAVAVVPGFAVTPVNADDVRRVCQAVEGVPLAIELAAVRLRSLSVGQLADRLHERFTLLSAGRRAGPERHGTLRALLGWSHELCTEQERLLWARATVFAGSFDLRAAEAVCAGAGLSAADVLDTLDGLLDKSILQREEHDGTARYRMLEMVRQYGQDQLSTGELDRLRRGHRDFYLSVAQRFEADWFGPRQHAWLARLRTEHANLGAAMDFSATSPDEATLGLRLLNAITQYWFTRGLLVEARHRFAVLFKAAPDDAPDRAGGLWMSAFLALLHQDRPAYDELIEQAEAAAEASGEPMAMTYVRLVRAHVPFFDNDLPLAAELFGAVARDFGAAGEVYGELWALRHHGLALGVSGDLDRGRQVLAAVERRHADQGEVMWRSWVLYMWSATEYLVGDYRRALELSRQALRTQGPDGIRVLIGLIFNIITACQVRTGRLTDAVRLAGAAGTVWQEVGGDPTSYGIFADHVAVNTRIVTERLDQDTIVEEISRGRLLSPAEAIAFALDEKSAAQPGVRPKTGPLTKREAEIADLVAEGLTNQEIADRLVISRRTAETHVDHILTKLEVHNRAQIASWVAARRPPAERD
ncbi:non-specific serine/threonine protein kinase [Actinokineospora alba]|uniref:Non-specific serine/threonine protein kinase n=1 Tax=Actinokineospora alba TaxID=504798 RepID=A0A1H0QS24_9PSEU|nr:LuxR C-terminal-related transcriptional regulator [Actinokineospora alba]TDP70420.1 non-specific serine/threonine protein kinase [Actinokineospora alba]SDI31980.1 non-specific serine/threonine protein kinase [Actinokineospora alba]SDP20153.1 non-specific serine/threonine protein kinase [Actinokineospora alba]